MRISDWSSDVCSSDLTKDLQFAAHTFGEQRRRQVVHLGCAEIEYRRRAGVTASPCLRQQRQVECGEIALPDKCLAAVGHRPPINERQQAAKAVASACRSEEHTSELQSLMRISYAVFCLKKKQHT